MKSYTVNIEYSGWKAYTVEAIDKSTAKKMALSMFHEGEEGDDGEESDTFVSIAGEYEE
jgi:hypothetical protein